MSLHPLTAPALAAGPRRAGSQLAIPCWFMRGGTSKGPFFRADDLPQDPAARDAILLAAMGSPDPRQIDGLGGAHPLTSKAGIVAEASGPASDLEFLFAQLQPDSDTVDTTPNCGNMLAAVVPFAIESGLLIPDSDITTARVLTLNTSMVAEISVPTPVDDSGRYVEYSGDARIDGVPGAAAAVDNQLPRHRRLGLRFTAAHRQRPGHRGPSPVRAGGRDLHRQRACPWSSSTPPTCTAPARKPLPSLTRTRSSRTGSRPSGSAAAS